MIGELWEGSIIRIEDDGFYASIYSIFDDSRGHEEALFKLEETGFKKEDIIPGKIFYWVITVNGEEGKSHFGWKKMKPWTKEEIDRAAKEGAERAVKLREQSAT